VAGAVLTRLLGRARGKRVRFRDAVPVRRDRRDLRRQFRRAARAVTAERKATTTALLWRLSANRVPLSAVTQGTRATERIVEFSDGTRLLLAARHGPANLERLEQGACWPPVWLARANPGFTRHWFRLWFASASRAGLVEVRAAVAPAPP
jgi:hypothetical protein